MKSIKKIFAVGMALAVAFALVSCKQDVDNSVATYSATMNGEIVNGGTANDATHTLTFYNDDTWVYHQSGSTTYDNVTVKMDADVYSGTYTGDPTSDGEVVLTETKSAGGGIYEIAVKMEEAIASGETTFTITNAEAPLEDISSDNQRPKTYTISNGKLTFYTTELTRQ